MRDETYKAIAKGTCANVDELCDAIASGMSVPKIVSMILHGNINVNATHSIHGIRPIDLAARKGDLKIFKLLLKGGARLISADVNPDANILVWISLCKDKETRKKMRKFLAEAEETLPYLDAHIAAAS